MPVVVHLLESDVVTARAGFVTDSSGPTQRLSGLTEPRPPHSGRRPAPVSRLSPPRARVAPPSPARAARGFALVPALRGAGPQFSRERLSYCELPGSAVYRRHVRAERGGADELQ